jgi:capsular polysaccharide biosynthesis protein
VVGRLWGWDRAKAEIPDLKALFWVPDTSKVTGDEPKFRVPKAYGIGADDIVWTDEPVDLESLVAPSPMWHNRQPYYAHPGLRAVWERLGDTLIDEGTQTHERIFIGRTPDYPRRTCRNDQQVQEFFAERGFTVIYPELLDLGAQAALFAGATAIAGYGGSALFNVLFARNLQTLIVLNHHSYTARNEQLFASLLGAHVHYFWSQADISHPPGGRSMAAVESDWEFDFAHNGRPLEALLATL